MVKSSRLPMKTATYLVSIGLLLCLAFLYGWRLLHKISLDWPLTLTTQLLLQNFLTTLHRSRSKSLMKSSLEWVTIKHLHTLGFFFCFLQQCPKKQSCHSELQKKKIFPSWHVWADADACQHWHVLMSKLTHSLHRLHICLSS